MNKRDAKREACAYAANLIDSSVAVGADLPGTTDADIERVQAALEELADELARRGEPRRSNAHKVSFPA